MVLLVLVPLLLGVVAYRAPIKVAKGLIVFSQLAAMAFALFMLFRSLRVGEMIQTLGGADRRLYIELAGNPITLALVVLVAVLLLAATVCGLKHATHKLILLYGILQGLMSGIFLTNDIFNLFVLLEVVTLVMVLLNVYRREVRSVYDALYYLIIQIVGMTFFLFGLGYLYRATGQLSMTLITQTINTGLIPAQSLVIPFALILVGLGLKVGLFPLFSYVPRFYGNPGAPISVLMLSSSLISTAALFWIARVAWAFRPLNTGPLLITLGTLTAFAGAAKALAHHDARLVLAFSTVSQAGLALIAIGSGTATSDRGFIAHLFTHALAKALLFLAVGALVEKTHSSKLEDIRHEVWRHPLVALSMAVGAISLIGIPLTAGGVSKYWIMSGSGNPLVEAITWLITLGTALIMGRILVPHHSVITAKVQERLDNGFLQNSRLRSHVYRAFDFDAPVDSSPIPEPVFALDGSGLMVSGVGASRPMGSVQRESTSSVDEPEPMPWAGPEPPPITGPVPVGPQPFPVRSPIAAVLAAMVVMVLVMGMAGTNAMGALMGSYYGISGYGMLTKALQLAALIIGASALIWWLPRNKWWPRTALTGGFRDRLARSLALPDAILAAAMFFAAVLLFAFLPGVL